MCRLLWDTRAFAELPRLSAHRVELPASPQIAKQLHAISGGFGERMEVPQAGEDLGSGYSSLIPVIPFYAEIQEMREAIETPARDRISL